MADITKCNGYQCPRKELCYRYTANVTDQWQAWFVSSPLNTDDSCELYYPLPHPRPRNDNANT